MLILISTIIVLLLVNRWRVRNFEAKLCTLEKDFLAKNRNTPVELYYRGFKAYSSDHIAMSKAPTFVHSGEQLS